MAGYILLDRRQSNGEIKLIRRPLAHRRDFDRFGRARTYPHEIWLRSITELDIKAFKRSASQFPESLTRPAKQRPFVLAPVLLNRLVQ